MLFKVTDAVVPLQEDVTVKLRGSLVFVGVLVGVVVFVGVFVGVTVGVGVLVDVGVGVGVGQGFIYGFSFIPNNCHRNPKCDIKYFITLTISCDNNNVSIDTCVCYGNINDFICWSCYWVTTGNGISQ